MDLLQVLDFSKKSSSPFSEPSKSNLHHRRTGGQADTQTDTQTGRQTSKIRGMGEARSARQLGREPGVYHKSRHQTALKSSAAPHSIRPERRFIHLQQDKQKAFYTFFSMHKHFCFPGSTGHLSTQQLVLRPRPVPLKAPRIHFKCVHKYSHDSTLGKGEVLHQDVKTSVLIVEELPDPPVNHREVNRKLKHTHITTF